MNHHSETTFEKIKKGFPFNKQTVGYFFLGIGFTMFLLNIITIVNFSNMVSFSNVTIPLTGYYISVISSIILMTYSIYNIYDLN